MGGGDGLRITVYQMESEEYGPITFASIEDVLQEIKTLLENSLAPDTVQIAVKIVRMTEEELSALDEIEF